MRETKDPTTGQTVAATPCNAAAAESGGAIAMLMMLASLGYCIADVAADGLTVSLARAEPAADATGAFFVALFERSAGAARKRRRRG